MPRRTKPSTSTASTTSVGPAPRFAVPSKLVQTGRSVSRGVSRFAGKLASQFTTKRREQAELVIAWTMTSMATALVLYVTLT